METRKIRKGLYKLDDLIAIQYVDAESKDLEVSHNIYIGRDLDHPNKWSFMGIGDNRLFDTKKEALKLLKNNHFEDVDIVSYDFCSDLKNYKLEDLKNVEYGDIIKIENDSNSFVVKSVEGNFLNLIHLNKFKSEKIDLNSCTDINFYKLKTL